jgi:branched-chain amino acid transport system permease protein
MALQMSARRAGVGTVSAQRMPLQTTILARPFFWVIVLVTVAFAVMPVVTEDIALRERLMLAAIFVTLATSLNMVVGYTRYVNFGHITFFGLGGYIVVYLVSKLGWPLWFACAAAGIVVSSLALLFGLGVLRLRGAYFGLATIGVNEGIKAFVSNFDPWGGSTGLYVSMDAYAPLGGPGPALWVIYFMAVAAMGLSLVASYAIKKSKFGLGLMAIGQNEDAAAVLGVPTSIYKALAYSASAFMPAVVGGLFFFKSAFIQPTDAFDISLSIEVIAMVMLGGLGTITGAAFGAFVYEELRSALLTSVLFSSFQLVIAGLLLLLIVLFFPSGLMGWIFRRWPRLRRWLE